MEDDQREFDGPGKYPYFAEVNPISKFELTLSTLQAKESEEQKLRAMPNQDILLKTKIQNLNQMLQKGLADFSSADLSDAAAEFRKIARDIKKLEDDLLTRGTYNPRNSLNDLTGTEWLRHTKSWFVIDGKAADIDKDIENHPGSYPPELAAHFIELFSKRGGMVLDPFMGVGSTLAAAVKLHRNCIGFELNPQYATYAQGRVEELNSESQILKVHTADARKIAEIWQQENYPLAQLCLTSPPYWNMLATSRGGVESNQKQRKKQGVDTTYSIDPRDLANIANYDEYVSELARVFSNLRPILAEGGYVILVLQNCRPKDGVMKPLAWDVARELSKSFLLRQEFVWLQDQKFLGIWGYPTTYVSNVHHHYCIVLQKSGKTDK